MTRVLFMGSSHLGAVKLGYERTSARYPQFDVDFFGAPAKVFASLALDDDLRFGVTEKAKVNEDEAQRIEKIFGRRVVNLRDYDKVVIIGFRVEEIANAQILSRHAVPGLSEAPDLPPMTREAYEALISSYLANQLPDPVWAGIHSPEIYFVVKPRMSESCVTGTSRRTQDWQALMARGMVRGPQLAVFLACAQDVFAARGLRLIVPPPEVLGETGLTRADFARATAPDEGVRLSADDFDHSHMNAAYGEIMVGTIFAELGRTGLDRTD